MRISDFALSLWVRHPSADLADLPTTLGLTPVRVWKVGDPRTTPKNTPLVGTYRESYCCMNIETDADATLPNSITATIEKLRPHTTKIDSLCATGGTFLLNVGWHSSFNTGENFEVRLLRELADMNVSLGIDVYCDNCDPSE